MNGSQIAQQAENKNLLTPLTIFMFARYVNHIMGEFDFIMTLQSSSQRIISFEYLQAEWFLCGSDFCVRKVWEPTNIEKTQKSVFVWRFLCTVRIGLRTIEKGRSWPMGWMLDYITISRRSRPRLSKSVEFPTATKLVITTRPNYVRSFVRRRYCLSRYTFDSIRISQDPGECPWSLKASWGKINCFLLPLHAYDQLGVLQLWAWSGAIGLHRAVNRKGCERSLRADSQ